MILMNNFWYSLSSTMMDSGNVLYQGMGLSDRYGNVGYPALGDTGNAILQGIDEIISVTIINLLRPVAIFVQ